MRFYFEPSFLTPVYPPLFSIATICGVETRLNRSTGTPDVFRADQNPGSRLSSRQAFIDRILPYALHTQKMTKIPASVTLSQAILESGWGKHAPGNNFFGIKGQGPAGVQYLYTTEIRQGRSIRLRSAFRKYHHPLESFLDHARLLSQSRHFKHAMAHTHSAQTFVEALQSGKLRYATDPLYVKKIMRIIHKYRLHRFDHNQV